MSTQDNLQAAFAGESQANRKYLAYAKKADEDGFPQIARLFRGAAAAETIHAHMHLANMDGIGDTAANVQDAVEGEGFEYQKMYPDYLKEAQAAGDKTAAKGFAWAMRVEEVHHGLYSQARQAVERGQDLPERKVFVCGVCGNTVYDEVPDTCPICSHSGDHYSEVA